MKKSDEKIAKTINTSSLEQVDDQGQFVIQKQEKRQPDKMLQNPSEDENKYLELDPDFIQWVDHAETKDHFNDLLGI